MKKYTLTLLLTAAPLFAGTPAPVAPAPQQSSEQGFTLSLEAMALRPFQSDGGYEDSDYDFGYRVALGYQFNDGLFVKASYFGYGTDVYGYGESDIDYLYHENAELDVSALDLVVGQNFRPTDTLKLSPFVGLRWATFEEEYNSYEDDDGDITTHNSDNDFEGLGIVVGVDVTRTLANNFSLYGFLKQSVVFGSTDTSYRSVYDGEGPSPYNSSEDTVVSITELGLGVQYDFCFSSITGNIRAGVEGQWWGGLSDTSSGDKYDGPYGYAGNGNTGLAGFVLGANFRF